MIKIDIQVLAPNLSRRCKGIQCTLNFRSLQGKFLIPKNHQEEYRIGTESISRRR